MLVPLRHSMRGGAPVGDGELRVRLRPAQNAEADTITRGSDFTTYAARLQCPRQRQPIQ